MAPEIDDALPTALDCRKKSAEMEAEKASEYISKLKIVEAEKKELLDRLAKPSGVSDEERMKRAGRHHQTRREQWPERGRSRPVLKQIM